MVLGVGAAATPVYILPPLCIADTQVNRHRSRVYTLYATAAAPENFALEAFGTREIAAGETASVVQF